MLSPTLATELTQGKSSDFAAPALYVLPPSSLTGQLRRNRHPTNCDISIVDERTRQHSVQIEFDACFGDLQLQLSRDLCIATVRLAELMAHEQNLKEQFSRRPNVPVYRNTQKWWRYAAGEIRPPLRSYFNATMHTTFEALAGEAKLNVRYVNAYTNYLVRGLIDASEVPSGAEQETVSAAGSDLRATSEDSEDNFRRQADHQWPVSRIATLRLVAMRRAAATLQKGLKPRFPSTSDRLSPDELASPMGLSSSIPRRSFTESAVCLILAAVTLII
ncbi:unnamed protein product [Dicrocoelium dendriticum]|nr:unnamed protein product [Dicrocoelium dendriticum]